MYYKKLANVAKQLGLSYTGYSLNKVKAFIKT